MKTHIHDNLPYTLFTSIKFVAPSIWPKCMAETCSSVVLHVNYKHCAANWQWNCAYRTAAQKVNSSRRIVTDRLKKDCNLWNCCCQLKKGKF